MKQVRETSAGKSISAFVILNKRGEQVATVQAHYANSGRVTVNVWQTSIALDNCCKRPDLWSQLPTGQDYKYAAYELWGFQESHAGGSGYDCYTAALAGLIVDGHTLADHSERESWAAHHLFGLQQYSAGGSGYDCYTAALAGLIIDGHTIADHSGLVPEDEKKRSALLKKYQRDPRAYGDEYWREKAHAIGCHWANWTTDGWRSLHFIGGLDRLERLGYRVIQAI